MTPAQTYLDQASTSSTRLSPPRRWLHQVITLLDAAVRLLHPNEGVAQVTLREAASLLRQQLDPPVRQDPSDGKGRLLPWQAHKVHTYIDRNITGPLPVCDLSAVLQLSEAHFSRSFKLTFGEPPHAYVVRRRLEFATHHMLQSDASLSDIALRCGFSDQAHLCKQFRVALGYTPAAWRRAQRIQTML
jgi:AraC family transcriptional regulator